LLADMAEVLTDRLLQSVRTRKVKAESANAKKELP